MRTLKVNMSKLLRELQICPRLRGAHESSLWILLASYCTEIVSPSVYRFLLFLINSAGKVSDYSEGPSNSPKKFIFGYGRMIFGFGRKLAEF